MISCFSRIWVLKAIFGIYLAGNFFQTRKIMFYIDKISKLFFDFFFFHFRFFFFLRQLLSIMPNLFFLYACENSFIITPCTKNDTNVEELNTFICSTYECGRNIQCYLPSKLLSLFILKIVRSLLHNKNSLLS